MNVVVGASYASVNSPYPEKQWCYARSLKSISNNTSPHLDLGEKKGVAGVVYNKLTRSDASAFGATKYTLEALKRHCEFFPAISPVQTGPGGQDGDLESRFPSSPPASIGKSGTGFYINKIGYVVTNNHVVDGCSSIWVNHDKKDIPAIIIKNDKTLDIAVIKADIRTNFYAEFANKIRTGEDVMALGFPQVSILGSEIKRNKGSISSLTGMQGNNYSLQHTALIQKGSSGGPLLNNKGSLVGVNYAKFTDKDLQGIGLAIQAITAVSFLGENSIDFEMNKRVATALAFGIRTDTLGFTRDFNAVDIRALSWLNAWVDSDLLRSIETPPRSQQTLESFSEGLNNRILVGKTLIAPISQMPNRDALAQIADFLLPTADVDNVIVFGPRRGRIILSARTSNPNIHIGRLLAEKWPDGLAGGHKALAGGQIPFEVLLDEVSGDVVNDSEDALKAMAIELEKVFN